IGAIALSVAKLDNPAVAAVPITKSGSDRFENFLCYGITQQIRLQLTAGVKVVPFTERDHLLRKRSYFFCLRQGDHQTAVIEKVRHEIPQQRPAMRRVTAEFAVSIAMSHTVCSVCAGMIGRPCSSSFMPRERPIPERISLISLSDLRPKFLVLSISASVLVTSSPIVRIFAFFRQL